MNDKFVLFNYGGRRLSVRAPGGVLPSRIWVVDHLTKSFEAALYDDAHDRYLPA